MKTANEMRTITNEVLNARETERKAETVAYVENEIIPIIEECARNGFSSAYVSLSTFYVAGTVKEILLANGYKLPTPENFGRLLIQW